MSDIARLARLSKLFNTIIRGGQPLTPHNNKQFLEAICAQPDPSTCISNIITNSDGLCSVQSAMRFDINTSFLNGPALKLLQYLEEPELKKMVRGEYLSRILIKIVDPPIFWNALREAFLQETLSSEAKRSFAWLFLQLVSANDDSSTAYRESSDSPQIAATLISSPDFDTRTFGQKIKTILDTFSGGATIQDGDGPTPGGRHDNDHLDFHKISILPTADELQSNELAFIRPSHVLENPQNESTRVALHLDNQFRLLREDMVFEMREEIQMMSGKKKGHHRGVTIKNLKVIGVHCGQQGKRCNWGIVVECNEDLPQFFRVKDRKKYLDDHRNFLKHQSLGCLYIGGEIAAFPIINRDEELLVKKNPRIILQLENEESIKKALRKLQMEGDITLVQIDTAVFAYEPVLRALQQASTLPLSEELLLWKQDTIVSEARLQATHVVDTIRSNPGVDLRSLLGGSDSIRLDVSQTESLLSGLIQRLSLIQGPPGTGKSYIGSLLAKAIHDFTDQTILVVCYTNHALDDILEGLLKIGIPSTHMVRLGGKSTPKTESLLLNKQGPARRGRGEYARIDELKSQAEKLCKQLEGSFDRYRSIGNPFQDIMEHIEFEDPAYYSAFQVPQSDDGMTKVGRGGRAVSPFYLMEQWVNGRNAGIFFGSPHVRNAMQIWKMPLSVRQQVLSKWTAAILEEKITEFWSIAKEYNATQDKIARMFSSATITTLRSKRIIGCTTTAAAKYTQDLQAASPNVLLVEEAGEILESHILTALSSEMNQIILIGDHKQLRPKVNNYLLTVEKGEGYDLNRSLFERLILKGYPHTSLTEQHRMRPEISSLVRRLTYPELIDAEKTKNRPDIRGLQDNIIFIDHAHPEDEVPIADRKDMASKSSKQNYFEVEMVLKIVRYLAQQGYGTDKLVILTPYLGQLQKLRDALKDDNDPILNDLDSSDLVRAGLVSVASANVTKKPIRLATIDNYQGEESDIVIVSLTRSNSDCDIGFMFSPERLNVLLSRARNALIIIGNSHTFKNARKGKELWTQLFTMLAQDKHMYDGLPAQCHRHPDRKVLLLEAKQFDVDCPDGGCDIPCGTMLNCGLHPCSFKCHQISDHSKMACEQDIMQKCPNGHEQHRKCCQVAPATCRKCEQATKLADKRKKEALEEKNREDALQQAHLLRMAEIEAQIQREVQAMRSAKQEQERADAIRQKQSDLANAQAKSSAKIATHSAPNSHAPVAQTPSSSEPLAQEPTATIALGSFFSKVFGHTGTSQSGGVQPDQGSGLESKPSAVFDVPSLTLAPSPSVTEWERQKAVEGAENAAIDSIMDMTGLESVKDQVLSIKAKIDTSVRQNTSLKQERFNIVFLGNPGTGKTTVARHYADFLASAGVLPGNHFVETTGSRLATEGVDGTKKCVEGVLTAGGGAIFVDETYQLASQHNFQGGQVLDFLLAEMENNIGKLVFIFAGYDKEMEKFFEHNPGLPSRVPYKIHFADYEDKELLSMFKNEIDKLFQKRMKVEGGMGGIFSRIAVRRLGRRRGRAGFGNARELKTLVAKIRERQAKRLTWERKEGRLPDDLLFLAEDLIGPDPSTAIVKCKAWTKLESLIGLKDVKESISNLFDIIQQNYRRELAEQEPIQVSLNRVFLGSPGTGKTSVAKLYGQILADLGLLSSGEVVIKNPADFVGSALGQSEANTKGILANSVGKVLIIDEAYMLYGGGGDSGAKSDPYKTSVIDTIVAEVQSVPGEDRCVLLLGYKDQMMEMFQNVNPGLSRRFRIEESFNFEDFNDSELLLILDLKLKDQHLDATKEAKDIALEVLSRLRYRPNFGNAGDVENVISKAKAQYMTRMAKIPAAERPIKIVFEPQDFDADFDRNAQASSNLSKIFEDVVGCDHIVARLRDYQKVVSSSKRRNLDPREQIPTNFVFKGPPGTGKTTIARKMGRVYYDMGILSSSDVIECSAADLVGQYVGQTGPKTKKLFEKGLGKVLFVDEAYRLSEGHFAQEAIDEVVGLLTHPKFKSKIIVILAGYDDDMNRLMSVNTGLSSRFPDEIIFPNMEPESCLEVVRRELEKKRVVLDEISDPSSQNYMKMLAVVKMLSDLADWGNARDMTTLSKKMVAIAYLKDDESNSDGMLKLSGDEAVLCMKNMLEERRGRSATKLPPRRLIPQPPERILTPPPPTAPVMNTVQTQVKASHPPVPSAKQEGQPQKAGPERDDGISDADWNSLQAAKRANEAVEKARDDAIKALQRKVEAQRKREKEQQALIKKLAKEAAEAKEAAKQNELKRLLEQARLKEQAAKEAKAKEEAALRAKQQEAQRLRQQEQKIQAKLRELGICPAGYRWINRGDYYQCSAGGHIVPLSALGI